ncbi:MAG: Bcr/CflA family drug resistance efflux transporter [Pseudomonadales bacterium]|jgi:MFS transporter, DHA1 family, multidrug resistance protein|uniref:multidrug effflux MFS transporter n=1 Tax=Pseudomonas sp. TaxID=306 RepID=UPI000C53AF7F|nr:Bcr/CflA family drug resistance efflux transporter [Pseudomonadales bacterium]|tara:strand:+ start:374 stop:1603 length:1230 start_codon:yes stop_codon:yes gene_type:complete
MTLPEKVPLLPGWLFLLAMLTALSPLSVDLYLPAFPVIASQLQVSSSEVQITLAVFLLGMAFGQLLYGPLSDLYGRKPPLYAGLTLFFIASIGCAFAADLTTLTAARFCQALGGGAGVVISRAVIRDRTSNVQAARAFSMLMLMLGLGPILAPLAGGALLQVVGWRGIFMTLAACGLALLLGVHFCMRETSPSLGNGSKPKLRSAFNQYLSLACDWKFMRFVLVGALPFGGMFAYVSGSPKIIIDLYGIQPNHFGWFFGLNAFGMIVGSQLNAKLVARYGPATLLKYVLLAPAIATLMATLSTWAGTINLSQLMLCFFIYMTSMGLLTPNAVALAMASQGHRAGSASSVIGFIQFLFGTLAVGIVSLWMSPSALPVITVMLGLSAASLLLHRISQPNAPGQITEQFGKS